MKFTITCNETGFLFLTKALVELHDSALFTGSDQQGLGELATNFKQILTSLGFSENSKFPREVPFSITTEPEENEGEN